MEKKKKKKHTDYSIYINLFFILIFIAAGLGLYIALGKKDAAELIKESEQMYKNKLEQPKPIVIPKPQAKETTKDIPQFEKYNYKFVNNVTVTGEIKNFDLDMLVPVDENEKQILSNTKIEIKPTKFHNDGTNTYAKFYANDLGNTTFSIIQEGTADVRTYTLETAKKLNKNISPEKDLSRYLKPEPLIESDDPFIKDIANQIKGSSQEEIIQNIYEYTQKSLTYRIINQDLGAKKALQVKYGKCSEFTSVMVALCRAKKIPARIALGYLIKDGAQPHSWAEVYFDKYGWVAFDPTRQATVVNIYDAKGKLVRQEKRFDISSDKIKYITFGRNKLSTYNLLYSVSDKHNGRVSIQQNASITKAE